MKKYVGTALLLLASVALIGAGISQGQPQQVLTKAIHVCLECIGVG